MGERKQMTNFYNEEYIKQIKWFEDSLVKDLYKTLDGLPDHETIYKMKWHMDNLQIAVKALYIVIKNEMHQTNKIRDIISKLPDDEKYQKLKSLLEERDSDIEETIRPLSDYTKELEESRKKRPDYIG